MTYYLTRNQVIDQAKEKHLEDKTNDFNTDSSNDTKLND